MIGTNEMKKCMADGLMHPVENFYKQKANKTGLDSYCKQCRNKYTNEYRRTHRTRMAELQRQYYQSKKQGGQR